MEVDCMPRRHRSAGGRSRRQLSRFAAPAAISVALVIAVGAVVAIVDHSGANNVADAANANCASPAAYVVPANASGHGHHGSGSGASPTAAASSTASATTAATGTALPTTTTAAPATATTGTAPTTPISSAAPFPTASATGTTTTAAANVNCDIIVPANPLSATGLSTPYQLTGPNGMSPAQSGCTMANAGALGAFVQATILNPRTGQLYVYNPLVITQGTTPAVAPVVPALPRNAVVTIDFGFNGTDLNQVGATGNALRQGNCVNGQANSVFGQVSFCNGTNFFT